MTEGGETADTLAQGELERGHRGELVSHAQYLERLRAARIEDVVAFAETVDKSDGRGSVGRCRSSLHCQPLYPMTTSGSQAPECSNCAVSVSDR